MATVTREYTTWVSIKMRCTSPKGPYADLYFGRGLKVCAGWSESFATFFADMGERPSSEHSIDRIDNDGNYSKEGDRELVREIADTFADYADYLDGIHPDANLTVIERAGVAAKEAGESVFEAVKGGDPHRIVKEATDAEIAFRDLKQTAYAQMRPTRRIAAEAVSERTNGKK